VLDRFSQRLTMGQICAITSTIFISVVDGSGVLPLREKSTVT
jgi:hypothetical protein